MSDSTSPYTSSTSIGSPSLLGREPAPTSLQLSTMAAVAAVIWGPAGGLFQSLILAVTARTIDDPIGSELRFEHSATDVPPSGSLSDAGTPLPVTMQSPKRYILHGLESSTTLRDPAEDVYDVVARLFRAAKEEEFEDGMESDFSKGLRSLVTAYSKRAIEAMTHLIVYEKVNPEVASEALRSLGSLEDVESYQYRRWLLERALQCSSPVVRDGAALGLAFMDDPHAIAYIRQAINREQCSELREDMEQVLVQLESTGGCRTS